MPKRKRSRSAGRPAGGASYSVVRFAAFAGALSAVGGIPLRFSGVNATAGGGAVVDFYARRKKELAQAGASNPTVDMLASIGEDQLYKMKAKIQPVLNGSCTFDDFFSSFLPGEGAGPGSTAVAPWTNCKYAVQVVRRYVLANDDDTAQDIKAAMELKQRQRKHPAAFRDLPTMSVDSWRTFLKSDALQFKAKTKTATFALKPHDPRQRLRYASAVLSRLSESAFQHVVQTRLMFVDEFSYCYGGRPTGVRHGWVPKVSGGQGGEQFPSILETLLTPK